MGYTKTPLPRISALVSALIMAGMPAITLAEQEVFARPKPGTDHALSADELAQLRALGQRFAELQRPATGKGKAVAARVQQEKALAQAAQGLQQSLQQTQAQHQQRLQAAAEHIAAHRLPELIRQRQDNTVKLLSERHQQLQALLAQVATAERTPNPEQRRAAFARLNQQLDDWNGGRLPASDAKPAGKAKVRAPIKSRNEYLRNLTLLGVKPLQVAGPLPDDGALPVLPQLPSAPQPADTAANEDVQLTPAIRDLAAQLHHNPAEIYKWVYDHIDYVPSYGSLQGADQTLASRRGNAFDTSSLLIALLRASDIPARYVYGTIEVPAEQALNWVGDVATVDLALDVLAQGGVPSVAVTASGQSSAIQMEHVWVEAYVDFVPSRGVVNRTPDSWIPLDASFKRVQRQAGIALQQALPVDGQALLNEMQAGATVSEQGCQVQGIHLDPVSTALGQYQQKLAGYLDQQPDATWRDLVGSAQIKAYAARGLSSTLPYKVTVAAGDFQTLPDTMRHYLSLKLYQNAAEKSQDNPAFNVRVSVPQLGGHTLALGFEPSTDADRQALASYLPAAPANGQPYAWSDLPSGVPGYLIHVTPVLTLDGQVLKRAGEFMLGQGVDTRLGFVSPNNAALAPVTTRVIAGSYQVLATDLQGQGPAQLDERLAALNTLQTRLAGTNAGSLTRDDVLGQLLTTGLVSYFAGNDAEDALAATPAGLALWRAPSLARFGAAWRADESYGIPLNAAPAGLALAVDQLNRQVIERQGDTGLAGRFVRSQRVREQWYQNQVPQQLLGTPGKPLSASNGAVALLAAAGQGQRLTTLTADNSTRLLPGLNLGAADADALQRGLTDGAAIVLGSAQQPLLLGDSARLSPYAGFNPLDTTLQLGTRLEPAVYGWSALLPANQSAELLTPMLSALPAQRRAVADMTTGDGGARLKGSDGQSLLAARLLLAQLPLRADQACASATTALAQLKLLQASPLQSLSQNHTPEITSVPGYSIAAGNAYRYQVVAQDADGNPLTYRLLSAPTGVTLSAQGLLAWDAPRDGRHVLTVRVDDGQAYRDQSWTLAVGASADPLELNLVISPAFVLPGEALTVSVVGQGGSGLLTRSLTVDGQTVSLDSVGNASLTAPTTVGNHKVVATVSDGKTTVTRESVYTVRDGQDADTPVAQLSYPAADQEITAPLVVRGTVSDSRLAYYRLMLRPSGAPDNAWQEIAKGYQPVSNAALGKVDPTTHANGQYELGLFVTDSQGRQESQIVPVEFSRELKIGQFALGFTDLTYDASGMPLQVSRSYDTRRKGEALAFGYGWSLDYQALSVRKNVKVGLGWRVVTQGLSLCLQPIGKHKVSITFPEGQIERFEAQNATTCAVAQVPPVDIRFTPTNGASRLEAINTAVPTVQGGNLYDLDTGDLWNPSQFKLTRTDGTVFYLDESFGIKQIVDRWGNTLSFSENGVQHSNGQSLTFTRDGQHRVTKVTDVAGLSINYSYDSAGNLASVTDRMGRKTTFTYNREHGLTSYTDARGVKVATMEYDDQGRLVGMGDAQGRATQLTHDVDNHVETVKDRRGNSTTYRYDDAGNILEVVDALGHKTSYTYDANGNELTVTDALGHTITKTFGTDPASGDYNQVLTETDHLGHTTTYSYETPSGKVKTSTDARGKITQLVYSGNGSVRVNEPGRSTFMGVDGKGNLSTLEIGGNTTSYTYDSAGRKLTKTSPTGVVTHFVYDVQGRETQQRFIRTDNVGTTTAKTVAVITKQEYDPNGNVLVDIDAQGNRRTYEYNVANEVTKETDANGRSTNYEYDADLRLVKTTYPDGSTKVISYDANGNMTSTTDPSGRVTRMDYDALNRLVKTTYPDGSSIGMDYNAVGRVIAETNAAEQIMITTYDEAGRVTSTTDAHGQATTYGYDANGNRTSLTTPDLKTTTYVYDDLNRLIKTTLPDNKYRVVEWRTDGLKGAEVDENGHRVEFQYDGQGHLVKVFTLDPASP